MAKFAYLEPRQFLPASQGKVSLNIENLHATADIYLHPEYEKPLAGLKIAAGLGIPVFEWTGGILWISASADNVEYQILEIQPARGKQQESRVGVSTAGSSGSGGSGGSGGGGYSGGGYSGGGGYGGGGGGGGGGGALK